MRTVRLSSSLLLLALAAGCSDQYAGRVAVSGKITLQGQPLKAGTISFVPLEKQDTQSGAPVENGDYSVPRPKGLKPGKYLIQITSGDGKTPVNEDDAAGPGGSTNIVSVDLIPEDWNVKSTRQVDVKADGANKFDFDIPNVNTRKRR